jgi:predicted small lipoprotein YifL
MTIRPTEHLRLALIAALSVLLAACGRKAPAPAAPANVPAERSALRVDTHHPAGIDWFAGDVEAAFAAAKAADKPLYLYWGA